MEVAKSSNKADHSHKDIVSFLADKRADQRRDTFSIFHRWFS